MDSNNSIENLRHRVATNPVNLQYRFDFGVALKDQGDFDQAIRELLLAMNSPLLRWRSMKTLIEAYETKGMTEQAVQMRERLTREIIE